MTTEIIASIDGLRRLEQARDDLLARITQVLRDDERVAAAWLSGSFGRDEADMWSDLDLHVALADDAMPAALENARSLFERCGRVLLVQAGFPSNSMPGGWFWLVLYSGPIEVDWNIGPATEAIRPEASRLLFDRAGIPVAEPPPMPSPEHLREQAAARLAFFWAMAPIALKFVGRGHTRRAVEQIRLLTDAFITLWRATNHPARLAYESYHQNHRMEPELDALLPRPGVMIDPPEALRVIRALCDRVEDLHPALSAIGATVPAAVPNEVTSLADMVESVARLGGTSPEGGSRR